MYTEFISSEGLIRDAAKSVMKLDIYEKERPVGIQIFGANLDSMLQAVDIVGKTKPDIKYNYGCPVKKVVCKGAEQEFLKTFQKCVFNQSHCRENRIASYRQNALGMGS